MYVYLDRKEKPEDLPEALKQMFGEPQHVLDMVLTQDKFLARADAKKVLEDIEEKGFYLQMPPGEGEVIEGAIRPPKDSLNG